MRSALCTQGDSCTYSHGVYECWLHPAKYRTQLCKDGAQCRRPVCFFAHSVSELRSPTYTWDNAEVWSSMQQNSFEPAVTAFLGALVMFCDSQESAAFEA